MTEFATDYRQLDNDELLRLWLEGSQLVGPRGRAWQPIAVRPEAGDAN